MISRWKVLEFTTTLGGPRVGCGRPRRAPIGWLTGAVADDSRRPPPPPRRACQSRPARTTMPTTTALVSNHPLSRARQTGNLTPRQTSAASRSSRLSVQSGAHLGELASSAPVSWLALSHWRQPAPPTAPLACQSGPTGGGAPIKPTIGAAAGGGPREKGLLFAALLLCYYYWRRRCHCYCYYYYSYYYYHCYYYHS